MAFGDGSVIWEDQFAYSDGSLSTVGSAEWTNGYWTGQPSCRVVSGSAAGPSSAQWADNYTLDTISRGDGIDIIFRSVTKATGSNTATFFHIFGTPASSPSGYYASITNQTGTDGVAFGNMTSGSTSALISSSLEWTNGSDLGVRINSVASGGEIELFYKLSAGSWTSLGTTTNTARTSGRLAIEFFDPANRCGAIELLGISTGTTTPNNKRTLLGVGV